MNPQTYKRDIFVTKFEKDLFSDESKLPKNRLEYTFVQAFPRDITAMPVSYDEASVLKCSISFSFIRYLVDKKNDTTVGLSL